jgi:hypothetical protein
LVDLYSSGPDTNEDAEEFDCRNFIMNPELAMAAMDQENGEIIQKMINKIIKSLNCCASICPLFVPTHSANIITTYCKE